MSASTDFRMYRNLLTRLIVERRRRAGLTPKLDVRDWRTGAESEAELEERRRRIETFIDAEFGVGTCAALGSDPYKAILGGTEGRDRVLAILADRLRWNWRGLDRVAENLGGIDRDQLRRESAATGVFAAWSELEREPPNHVGMGWLKDRFDRHRVAAEPWALAHYGEPCDVVRWLVIKAGSAAEAALHGKAEERSGGEDAYAAGPIKNRRGESVSRMVAYEAERHVPPRETFAPPDDLAERERELAEQDEAEREMLLRRFVARLSALVDELSGVLGRLLAELIAADLDADRVRWPNRSAKKRLLDRLLTDPEVAELALALGWDVAA